LWPTSPPRSPPRHAILPSLKSHRSLRGNPSLSFPSSRRHSPLSLLCFLYHGRTTENAASGRRRPAATDHPVPRRNYLELRLIARIVLVQGIEPAFSQSTANSPIPLSGHHAPARFPTASDLVRLRRGVHQHPGEMEPLFPLFSVMFACCSVSLNSDGTVVPFCPRYAPEFAVLAVALGLAAPC
jgi:hypothetical protein